MAHNSTIALWDKCPFVLRLFLLDMMRMSLSQSYRQALNECSPIRTVGTIADFSGYRFCSANDVITHVPTTCGNGDGIFCLYCSSPPIGVHTVVVTFLVLHRILIFIFVFAQKAAPPLMRPSGEPCQVCMVPIPMSSHVILVIGDGPSRCSRSAYLLSRVKSVHRRCNISVEMSIMMLLSWRFFSTTGVYGGGGHCQLLHLCKNLTGSLISISAGSIPNKVVNLTAFLVTPSLWAASVKANLEKAVLPLKLCGT